MPHLRGLLQRQGPTRRGGMLWSPDQQRTEEVGAQGGGKQTSVFLRLRPMKGTSYTLVNNVVPVALEQLAALEPRVLMSQALSRHSIATICNLACSLPLCMLQGSLKRAVDHGPIPLHCPLRFWVHLTCQTCLAETFLCF